MTIQQSIQVNTKILLRLGAGGEGAAGARGVAAEGAAVRACAGGGEAAGALHGPARGLGGGAAGPARAARPATGGDQDCVGSAGR